MTAPSSPSDLASRAPEFVVLEPDVIIERFYTPPNDPIYFDWGRSGRMNAPDGSYGVLYVAEAIRGAFAETFLREPGQTLLRLDKVRKKSRVRLRVTRSIKLVKLAGSGLAKLGATAEVTHGGLPYDVPQSWSKAIHDFFGQPDGVAYRSRHDDEAFCYAIYDRASPHVEEHSRDVDIDRDWFWEVAALYGVGLAPFSR